MADVIGLNGKAEGFASLTDTICNDDHLRKVLLNADKFVSSGDSCHVAEMCPLPDTDSSKSTADVIPNPGYVIKAPANGIGMKVFVNVCKSESIEKPSAAKQAARGGRLGLSWTIPHTLTEQVIGGSQYNQTCRVFDFQVHPNTCRMAETNNRFKNMLNELAVGAVEREFCVHLNVRKLQFPKMKYKVVQVISKKKKHSQTLKGSRSAKVEEFDKGNILGFSNQQKNALSVDTRLSEVPYQENAKPQTLLDTDADIDPNNNKFTAPKYTVTVSANEEVPVINDVTFSEMVTVDIELPMVDSALAINLDVFKKSLSLTSTGSVQYKLEIDLPCVIDDNHSFAKFIKSRKSLHVVMPVLITSDTCISSVESSSTSYASEMLISNDVRPSAVTAEIACGEEADLTSAIDEHAVSEYEQCPTNSEVLQFSCGQDLENVQLIFSIKDVVPSSVHVDFISDRMCKIEMDKEVGDGSGMTHMCYFLKFDEDCRCKDDDCTVDTNDVSVSLRIAKDSQCHHLWNTFWTGPDIEHLKKREFLSSTCLMRDLESQDAEHREIESEDMLEPSLQVISSEADKPVNTVEKLQKSSESSEDASSEIVVVHEKGMPKLHGILKQRTVSESSDDGVHRHDRQLSTTTGSEGDDHEDSPDRSTASAVGSRRCILKKSVSFNNHVDRTVFQAGQSVSSMHAALKNRRRRARKRDQKQEQKEQRRRRRNSGSFSLEESGDEQATTQVETKKNDEYSHSAGETHADIEGCCSSPCITCDNSAPYCNTISDGVKITDGKAFSFQGVLFPEFPSGTGDSVENEAIQNALQNVTLPSSKSRNGNDYYSDAVRTTKYLVGCNSDIVNNSVQKPADDMSSIYLLGSDENCECEVRSKDVDVICANDVLLADSNASEPVPSCGPDSVVLLLKSSQDNNSSETSAECQSLSSKKTPVLNKCCLIDLDVD